MWRKILLLLIVAVLLAASFESKSGSVQAQAPNLLRDPGFESETYNWVSTDPLDPTLQFTISNEWHAILILEPRYEAWQNAHPSGYPHTGPYKRSGFKSFHIARGFATFNVVIFQQVSVQPNSPLTGGAFAFLDTAQGLVRAGIDPNGGTNPFAPTVVWGNWAGGLNNWVNPTVTTTARSGTATLFLQATQNQPSNPNGTYWDDAFLTGTAGTGSAPSSGGSGSPATTTSYTLTSNVALRVRRAPDLNAERFGTVLPGQQFDITGQSGQWYAINYYGQTGYVAGWLAIVTGGSSTGNSVAAVPGTITARARINVRSGAGTTFAPIGHLNAGESRYMTGQLGDWIEIDFNGRRGYVSRQLVTIN